MLAVVVSGCSMLDVSEATHLFRLFPLGSVHLACVSMKHLQLPSVLYEEISESYWKTFVIFHH